MRMKESCLILLLIGSLLTAQDTDIPKIFSPYVSDITVQQQGVKVIITWTDTQDLTDVRYEVYRSTQEINKENLNNAQKVAQVPQGKGWAEESPSAPGNYYYAVIAVDSNGKTWEIFFPYRNKSVTPLNFVPPTPPVLAPTTPVEIKNPTTTTPATITPATTTTVPEPPTSALPPVVATPETPKTTEQPILPGPKLDIELDTVASRPLPLPGRILDSSTEQALGTKQELQSSTSQIINSLLKSGTEDLPPPPEMDLLSEEINTQDATGPNKDLATLVALYIAPGKWAEGAKNLVEFAQRDLDKSRRSRGFYYAALCFLKSGDNQKALMNFLVAAPSVPEAKKWSDFLLTPGILERPLADRLPGITSPVSPENTSPQVPSSESKEPSLP